VPTSTEFRAAARHLLAAAEDATAIANRLWRIGNDHGVDGGRLEVLVDTALSANALTSDTLAQHCSDLAELCLQRAAVCDDYADQLAQWARSLDAWELRRDDWASRATPHSGPRSPGPRPRQPAPPASWVEVG
jgi:hypothetical protein